MPDQTPNPDPSQASIRRVLTPEILQAMAAAIESGRQPIMIVLTTAMLANMQAGNVETILNEQLPYMFIFVPEAALEKAYNKAPGSLSQPGPEADPPADWPINGHSRTAP